MHCTAVLGAAQAASTAALLQARLLGMARRAMATSLLCVPPPQVLLRPLAVPERLLLGPGPSNVPPRILAAGSQQLLGHMHPEVLQVMDEIKAGIQYAFQTRNRLTLAISGTGHCAMEAALLNLLDRDDTALVAVNGIWGQRAADIARRLGANVHELLKPPGPGAAQALGALHHARRVLHRGAAATGGAGRALPPPWLPAACGCGGITRGSPHLHGPAGEKMLRRKTKPLSFYLDMSWLANYWGCDGELRRYHHTAPINSFFSLREGLAMLAELGLENSWERHRANCTQLCQGLCDLGLELFVKEEKARLPTVTTVRVPEGYDWKEITAFLMDNYSIEIAGGLGPSVGKVLRIGLMGCNSTSGNVDRVLCALRDALRHCRHSRL
ncbi:serine--pyruvate aminotransferase isoform X2 [Falco rusticolus]|uniref:alanine--glyoxylate aminotransferase isoform X2 n=1 Tax=Falco peregrinus TaxID=8954 RepID=UPI000FFC2D09|nr:alanine--glyoxylate aminotransferase isoform X2 [Falco peregrinus]XP_027656905.1 alanine--glyoxylate aminotransferase isoform X2 [Falco cherrug]XP_037262132.1 serine--pyruvate aminotransferase isoform X2 [Falco rusticolus]